MTTAHIRTISGGAAAAGWSGGRTLTVDRPEGAGGQGLGFSGGELLLLAVGACLYNDLLREAGLRGIAVRRIAVDVSAAWEGEPPRARAIALAVTVEADAPDDAIRDLVRHTDRIAEVPATLRRGASVTLREVTAVSAQQSEEPTSPPRADAVLEMLGAAESTGATCAVLAPAMKARLRELAGGQVLEVRSDDPGAREDIAAWCRLAGHELLAVVEGEARLTSYFIGKKR